MEFYVQRIVGRENIFFYRKILSEKTLRKMRGDVYDCVVKNSNKYNNDNKGELEYAGYY